MRLQECLRSNDTVARLGGDEFVLVLTQLHTREECDVVLTRVRQAVGEPLPVGDGNRVRVGASIGVAFGPDDADEAESLLKTADAAMYRVKQAAKRTVGQADCLSASAG
jgi:diguanylate cyclase (GGDEF)-like protein